MYYKEKLKEIRELLELKQSEIAKILDISDKTYSAYEIEYEIIPSKHLVVLVDYLNISIDYLFDFTDKKQYANAKKDVDQHVVGERLKEVRKSLKLTQEKLASELHTTQSVIADYERGRYLIATPFLYTICKKHKISADYLLGKINEPKFWK